MGKKGEPVWDLETKIAKGKKQGCLPANTPEEFKKMYEEWVDASIAKAKSKPTIEKRPAEAEDEAAVEPPAKKLKEDEESENTEAAPEKKKKKKDKAAEVEE